MKSTFKKELIDGILHIIGGGLISYTLLPKAELWILLLVTGAYGAIREHMQQLRKHNNGHYYKKYTDTLEWMVGSMLYYFYGKKYIDADTF